jgi:hypothetical protein
MEHIMDVSPSRILTPARLAALTPIVILIDTLAHLPFTPGPETVSVPASAKARGLSLEPCDYPTVNGNYAADCGTLVVPENRADPQSRLNALPVTRIHARSDQRAEPIFRLEGGSGKTNMDFPMASRLAEDRDVVLIAFDMASASQRTGRAVEGNRSVRPVLLQA